MSSRKRGAHLFSFTDCGSSAVATSILLTRQMQSCFCFIESLRETCVILSKRSCVHDGWHTSKYTDLSWGSHAVICNDAHLWISFESVTSTWQPRHASKIRVNRISTRITKNLEWDRKSFSRLCIHEALTWLVDIIRMSHLKHRRNEPGKSSRPMGPKDDKNTSMSWMLARLFTHS